MDGLPASARYTSGIGVLGCSGATNLCHRGADRCRDRVPLGANRLDPAARGVDAAGDRFLDRRAVRHAAREIGKLDQVAALVLGQRPDDE
jgi:hypothetical protein